MGYEVVTKSGELYHHGIAGQKWGVSNGPPYPLSSEKHERVLKKAKKANEKLKNARAAANKRAVKKMESANTKYQSKIKKAKTKDEEYQAKYEYFEKLKSISYKELSNNKQVKRNEKKVDALIEKYAHMAAKAFDDQFSWDHLDDPGMDDAYWNIYKNSEKYASEYIRQQ